MSRLLDGLRKLSRHEPSRRKQWLIIAGALVLMLTGIGVLSGSAARPPRAETVHIFRAPQQPNPKVQHQSKPKHQAKAKAYVILRPAPYFRFKDPHFTAKFMAEYLNRGQAFDDVYYDVVTPDELMLHGTMNGSRFDLRLYKIGARRVLIKNCMMGSCYSDWAGALVRRDRARGKARYLLNQRVRGAVLRLAKHGLPS